MLDIAKERKRVKSEEDKALVDTNALLKKAEKSFELTDEIRLEIFEREYGSSLISEGEARLWRVGSPSPIYLSYYEHSFPFRTLGNSNREKYKNFDKLCEFIYNHNNNKIGCWTPRTVTDYGDFVRAEGLTLSQEETDKIIEIGCKTHNCELIEAKRPLLFGGFAQAVVLKVKGE